MNGYDDIDFLISIKDKIEKFEQIIEDKKGIGLIILGAYCQIKWSNQILVYENNNHGYHPPRRGTDLGGIVYR